MQTIDGIDSRLLEYLQSIRCGHTFVDNIARCLCGMERVIYTANARHKLCRERTVAGLLSDFLISTKADIRDHWILGLYALEREDTFSDLWVDFTDQSIKIIAKTNWRIHECEDLRSKLVEAVGTILNAR